MGYLGKQPALQASEYREEFNITSTTTNIITSGFVRTGSSNYLEVYRNGVLLGKADYTLQSDYKTIVLTNAAVAGDIVVVLGRRNLTQGLKVAERRHEHVIQNGETTVTFPFPLTADITDVYINGVKLWYGDGSGDGSNSDYAINPVTRVISFGLNPSVGDTVSIVSREPTSVSSTPLPLIDSNGASVISENGGVISLSADTANVGSNALVVDSSGNVGIGTSPGARLEVVVGSSLGPVPYSETVRVNGTPVNGNAYFEIKANDNRRKALLFNSGGTVRASISVGDSDEGSATSLYLSAKNDSGGASPHMTIDTSGNVGIGTDSPQGDLDVRNDTNQTVIIGNSGNYAAGEYGRLMFKEASSELAYLQWNGTGNEFRLMNRIGTLTFGTSNNEKMRIESNGYINIGNNGVRDLSATSVSLAGNIDTDSYFVVNTGSSVLALNRAGNDGDLIRFFQGVTPTLEGKISVSGTAISYNGGHLARFSQLADNTRDESIVKGTVMSNLDQMAEWTNDGVTEDNEQLNCMKVSDVEGDIDVAGVFVNWDNDDIYTNDMNIAMTGDMVIRIAQGTTVSRGDLLMSAGDGTAKPQDDDIVRSKTIAKVTSTHVSHTYEDGSYLVPCVLMAC